MSHRIHCLFERMIGLIPSHSTLGGKVWGKAARLSLIGLILCGVMGGVWSRADGPEQPAAAALTTNRTKIEEIEVGFDLGFVEQILGKPRVVINLKPVGSGLKYHRYNLEGYEVQIVLCKDNQVRVLVVRLTEKEARYTYPSIKNADPSWMLGKTSMADLGEPWSDAGSNGRWFGNDAMVPAYIEAHYFGRAGQYHRFFFCSHAGGQLDFLEDLVGQRYDRKDLIPHAVMIQGEAPKDVKSDDWQSMFHGMVEAPADRFE